MRTFAIPASLLLALPCLAQEPESPDISTPKAALAEFRAAQGDQWVVQWHPATGTPEAIFGTGLPLADWRTNSLDEARRHALQVLDQYRALLGLGTSDFREVIGARMGRSWSFTFEQSFRGVPAIGGRADVRINMKGVVAMLGSRAWQIPANFDVRPNLTAEVATAIAWDALGAAPTGVPQPQPPANPRLVIWGDIESSVLAPFALAWEVGVSNVDANGQGPIGRYYVDAKNGAVLHFTNDKHECGIAGCTGAAHATPPLASLAAPPLTTTVTVQGWTRTGNDAFSALANVPIPGLVVNVPGIGTRTTDQNGQFSIDIAAPVTITIGALDGRHHQPIAGGSAPSAGVTVNPGVATTIQLLTSGATTAEAAHTTATWWIDGVNEWARSILGNTSQLNTASNIAVTVNIASTCNAYYTANTVNFYAAGGGCSNTAFSTVVAHEWGHGLDERYGGISNSNAEGLSEGWGDIIGLYLVDSPLLGSGFQTAGVPLRNGNNTFLWPYSGSSPHAAGQVWMGFAWRLRENLRSAFGTPQAIAISNDIVISSIVANATTRENAVREVFIADDDDGNLLNGTPHYAQLSAAAIAKAIPYPEVVVATIAHTPLASTTQRLTPRPVVATVTPLSGSINQVRLHFNAGAGNVVRTMHPNGASNGYLALLPGLSTGGVSYHIEAVHSGGTTVRLPASGEFLYSIDGGTFAGFWSEGFETGAPGWTHAQVATQDDWQIGTPAGRSGTSSGVAWADPLGAASGSNCYGNDLGNTIGGTVWNGRYGANVENWLRSPVINCTGRTGVRLRFKRWLSVEEAIYDQATIFVNGVQLWQNPLNGNLQDAAWTTVEYAVPWADNSPSVQIEWRLRTDAGLHMGGWNIDDVELGETIVPSVDAELTMLPEQAVQGASITLSISTPSSTRPYLLVLGDTAGPTLLPPGFPPALAVGGALTVIGGSTDAAGNYATSFAAPSVPSAVGLVYYSQVLTLNAGFTAFVTSNPHVNLFTQTP